MPSARDDLSLKLAVVRVRMRRSGAAVLSASLDPGWTATVDGHVGTVQMAAPALVATSVPSGVHTIVLR
ncbi:MAG TPA: hypothetical protein VLW51_04770 [Solirubrobacteraceae bacterium]|nr:hypothetical protein [Solirubrobacteraceae bacterium]